MLLNNESESVKVQLLWRHGDLMVSELESRLGGLGLSPGQEHSAGFLDKTLNSHSASLTQVLMNLKLGVTLQWTSILSRGLEK